MNLDDLFSSMDKTTAERSAAFKATSSGAKRARPAAPSSARTGPSSGRPVPGAPGAAKPKEENSSVSRTGYGASSSGAGPSSLGKFQIPKRSAPAPPSSQMPMQKRPYPSNDRKPEPDTKKSSIFASNTESFRMCESIPTQLNFFELNLENAPECVDLLHLDILIIPENAKKPPFHVNGEKIKGGGDLSWTRRRWGLWSLWKNIYKEIQHLFAFKDRSSTVYDLGSCVFIPHCSYKGGDEERVTLAKDALSRATAYIYNGKIKDIVAVIKPVDTIVHLKGPQLMTPENRPSAIRFFECLTSQKISSGDYLMYGNQTFSRSVDQRNGQPDRRCLFEEEGKEVRTGFTKGMRILNGPNGPTVAMSIDVKRSPFYSEMPFIELLTRLLKLRDKRDLVHFFKDRDGRKRTMQLLDEMKTLAVTTTHMEDQRNVPFFITEFEFRPCTEIGFDEAQSDGTTRKTNIYEYYLDKYHIRIEKDFPLVVKGRGPRKAFFPIELLQIERGQRVNLNYISPKITKEMTGALSMKPKEHVNIHQTQMASLKLDWNENDWMRTYNIKVNTAPFSTDALMLATPQLNFGDNKRFTPAYKQAPSVRIPGNFYRGARMTEITLVVFDNCCDPRFARDFCESLRKACADSGMPFTKKASDWEIAQVYEADDEGLEEVMRRSKERGVSIVLAITKQQRPDVHDVLKLLETRTGMQTEHLHLATAKKFLEQGGRQTMGNVLRKLNLKGGGINYTFSFPESYGRDLNKKLLDKTLFVGFDMAHASATCLFDQQNNIACGEPTFVGVSYSLKETTELGGFSYAQKPREHRLQGLALYFIRVLLAHYKKTKCLPEKIVIYRVGAGEGDFAEVEKEITEIKGQACNDTKIRALTKGQPYKPHFVVLLTQKNSHYRIYPTVIRGEKAMEQNVPSGTCISNVGTVVGYEEFVLVSQMGLIGTVRPTRYTVLCNEAGWTLKELSHLTYFRSFGHQVSSAPPGMPDVLFAAENVAKRGRNNFKANQRRTKTGNRRDGVEDDDKGSLMLKLSEMLSCTSIEEHMYWA